MQPLATVIPHCVDMCGMEKGGPLITPGRKQVLNGGETLLSCVGNVHSY